ncbi:hypothetical protein KFZ56_00420 [Virgibacillus sp. NKC19-3]|uniref:hypothetical protein n=1 Tax=Virgibacillus saliphilus TaxID=2831674 RepID=UPI001C9A555E|nr:hypothetical protein [Virgibacillus sp. NKC19-3]MBY7141593.1 hypothetical protein [Virgibacillus sp. NKC19-3]
MDNKVLLPDNKSVMRGLLMIDAIILIEPICVGKSAVGKAIADKIGEGLSGRRMFFGLIIIGKLV